MMPLFDMMLRAQNGAAMDALGKQFGLAQEQVAQALAALMPAFSSGLKRTVTNPYDLSGLFSAMSSGNYSQYFEDLSKAFTPQGVADGNQVLQQLFGSKDVSRAIAAQAAQVTGIGQDILKSMLPTMADTIMGGLLKQGLGQMSAATSPFSAAPMAPMVQQWLEATGFAPKSPPKSSLDPFDNPFVNAWKDMMGVAQAKPAPKPEAAPNPFLDNPYAKAWQEMVNTSLGQTPEPKTKPKQEPEAKQVMAEMINTMFDSGLEVQKNYQKSMEKIFETYVNDTPFKASPTAQTETPPEPPQSGKA
ncbi:DUF937 domain-containing protein [Rhizobium sp.]|uniref:DUF937 domain-containing protein n=1 Tax=Rhizobium sp. TaxID=391 RepID=UPI000E92D21B|nr:hypothetical protein [Rhizobium sp.]